MVSYVTINDATLAYRLSGPGDLDAPLIITLHGGRGFGDHNPDFHAFSPLAENTNYRILSFDYRGHGLSSRTGPYTFAQLVEDIETLRQQFTENKPIILIAGSFGGFLAQQYAITHPQHVSHLILRGTAPSHHRTTYLPRTHPFPPMMSQKTNQNITDESEAIATLATRLARAPGMSISMLRDKIFGAFVDDTEFRLVMHAAAPLYVGAANFDADSALERARGMVVNADAHNALYSESEKYFDYRSSLGTITAKTLVIVGAEDWICPPKQSDIIAEGIPGAELVVLPGAGHSVHLEKNAETLRLIRRFLGV